MAISLVITANSLHKVWQEMQWLLNISKFFAKNNTKLLTHYVFEVFIDKENNYPGFIN
jgi:hypothetical protein